MYNIKQRLPSKFMNNFHINNAATNQDKRHRQQIVAFNLQRQQPKAAAILSFFCLFFFSLWQRVGVNLRALI